MEVPFELASPTHLQVEVTEDCNHSCFYCYNHWRKGESSRNYMNLYVAEKVSDIIIQDIKPFIVTITGGEPFKNFETTKYLSEKLGKKDISIGINTNLTEAKRRDLEELLDINKDIYLLVSIPSVKRENYRKITGRDNLQKLFENIKNVSQIGIPIYVNMVAHQLNKDEIFEEAKFLLEEYGVNSFAVTPMLRPALRTLDKMDLNAEENKKIYEDLIKLRNDFGMNTAILEVVPKCSVPEELRESLIFSRGCSAGKISSAISYNGDLRVCAHAPFSHGNLLEKKFSEIWENMKPWREHGYVPEECSGCLEIPECKGGCRFAAYEEGQLLNKKDYRMTSPVKIKNFSKHLKLNIEDEYFATPFKFRKERENQYTLNNKSKLLFTNKETITFLEQIQKKGSFKISEIPEGPLREKAIKFVNILYNKKFLELK